MNQVLSLLPIILFGIVSAEQKPNIILLLSDDQHWNETSVQMHPEHELSKSKIHQTPHLEKFAADGMRFSAAYAPAPVCSPTRISIQTGISPGALGWTKAGPSATAKSNLKLVPPPNKKVFGDRTTFAELLQKSGYATAHYGKWHLGVDPSQHGYDETDGNIGNEASGKFKDPNPTDIVGMNTRAISFMKKQQVAKKPFFIQLSYLALHSPENASQKNKDKFAIIAKGESSRTINRCALTADLDEGVGTIVQSLKDLKLDNNTYLIYMSDNGATGRSNPMITGSKGSLQEGGIRALFIIKGPGIKPNSWCHERIVGYDLFPTFCSLAKVTEPKPSAVEGGDISHLFTGSKEPVKRPFEGIVFHFPHYQAATPESVLYRGDYKLTRHYETGKDKLYNITTDLSESQDLSSQKPNITKQMGEALTKQLEAVNAGLPSINSDHDPNKPSQSMRGKGRKGAKGDNPERRGGGRQ